MKSQSGRGGRRPDEGQTGQSSREEGGVMSEEIKQNGSERKGQTGYGQTDRGHKRRQREGKERGNKVGCNKSLTEATH